MSYRKSRDPEADGPVMLSCKFCGRPASWEMLAALGARCRGCFDAYCNEPRPATPRPTHTGSPAQRVIAYVKQLEADGMRLTAVHRHVLDACRRKLGVTHE